MRLVLAHISSVHSLLYSLSTKPQAVVWVRQEHGRNVMRMLRVISLVLAGMGSIIGTPVAAPAQNYPNQVVRIVVPFSAGSITDGLARMLAYKPADLWTQPVILENQPRLPGTTRR